MQGRKREILEGGRSYSKLRACIVDISGQKLPQTMQNWFWFSALMIKVWGIGSELMIGWMELIPLTSGVH